MIPTMGILGAFTFAAQMVNIPIPGGTSGHLVGAVLLTTVLGAPAALLVLAAVLLIQCLLFQDGGLTALGANVVNMGLVGVLVAVGAQKVAQKVLPAKVRTEVGAFVGGWLATVLCAALVAVEIALSGRAPLAPVLFAMVLWHAMIGIIEGAATAVIVKTLRAARPDLVEVQS